MAHASFKGMSLFTDDGMRKYLSPAERSRFLAALPVLSEPKDRTFCAMLYWTGCRPSEARAVTPDHLDLEVCSVVLRSLKKRGEEKGRHFRCIPLPTAFLGELAAAHDLSCVEQRLWPFSRSTAWRRVHTVMAAAGLEGPKACAKGLRHSYGVTAALSSVPETRIKKWLGHASLATTEIYLDMGGPEDRAIAERMW
ncbi:MAG: tyrosine-type recombinase/integrase [Pseudomonadota bacterium]